MEDTSVDISKLRDRSPAQVGSVSRKAGICHNAWVIAGTRIQVASVKRLHEDGYSVAQIIEEYPDLKEADVAAAIAHEAQLAA